MNKNERIYWLNDNEVEDEDIFKAEATRLIGRVCLLEIWHEALRKREAIDERSAVVIRNIMANMDGWKEEKELKRYAAYGRQRKGYFRIGSPFLNEDSYVTEGVTEVDRLSQSCDAPF
jgi:hypothetical protein